MNIAIVDDRKTDSDRLVGFIDTYAEQHRLQWGAMDRFSSGEEFLGAFTAGKYDLIFLDIYMDGITGMETAKRIRRADHGCRIIFITTSPEFAVESYDVSASFYLLKPIEKNGVFAALDRCGLQDAERTRAVEVATHFGKTVLPVHDISYTEYVRRQVLINFEDVDKLLEDRFLLKSGIQIPISRLKYRNVREQFLEYSYSKVRGGQYGGTAY